MSASHANAVQSCDRCGRDKVYKLMPGTLWNHKEKRSQPIYGNALCEPCYHDLKTDVDQFAPAPGYSKPPAFIVAQTKTKTVIGKFAITLSICYGNWIQASIIHGQARKGKRFKVNDLKCKRYTFRQPALNLHSQKPLLPTATHRKYIYIMVFSA